jgi:choline dehydrogenase-like flavoprotein
MTFTSGTYDNFIADRDPVFQRVSPSYTGWQTEFDIIIVGTGIGGGMLADALADRFQDARRILVLEAGSFLYPTHVYNCSRLPNAAVASRFGCGSFWQQATTGEGNNPFFIGERPQMNLGGRSVFWSGLIPMVQPWELDFFPQPVRDALAGGLLDEAGRKMNQSVTLGKAAKDIVTHFRGTGLANDFEIQETPRALHQPYLLPDGAVANTFALEPTGVFNTAELLVNQIKMSDNLNSGASPQGLRLLLNNYVEDVRRLGDGRLEVVSRNTVTGEARMFQAGTVILAAGSTESPKLLRRSTLGQGLNKEVMDLVGWGFTDHPTTDVLRAKATHIGAVAIPRASLAKVVFYSKGVKDSDGVRYPFNIELNINHEYWHLRENDPTAPETPFPDDGMPSLELKFSFANPLDPDNVILPASEFGYVPEIRFRNQKHVQYLCDVRFPALAGWQKDPVEVFGLLNEVATRVFREFKVNGADCKSGDVLGDKGKGFGWGTVHHAVGSMRMTSKDRHDGNFKLGVVDEDLQVRGAPGLYVCDMSVMPFSAAANPVRHLAALALRMAAKIG